MKCPHCLENFTADVTRLTLFKGDKDVENTSRFVEAVTCANQNCKKRIISLVSHKVVDTSSRMGYSIEPSKKMVYPLSIARPNINPADIPDEYLEDYREACDVLSLSPKASAALSRRLLQRLIIEKAEVDESKAKNLFTQIGEVIDSSKLPSRICTLLDAVRVIGNFAAHPLKSANTGAVIDVEPGEAETNLEAIESLFDHYFTQERIMRERLTAIDKKLEEAGKPTFEAISEQRTKKKTKKNKKATG